MSDPVPYASDRHIRVLFVFAWLVVGGEETEVRLLARHLDPDRFRLDVVVCFHKDGMPAQTHQQLRDLGVNVDTTPYTLSFEDTIRYLERKAAGYDIIVSCQNVADIYPALERMKIRPPLIEHGGLVSEALAGPKHFTARYVGVCDSIRRAAASCMPDRPQAAVEIPSMVDLSAFAPLRRDVMRRTLGASDGEVLIGWVGRLDRKKRVEDFIEAAALVRHTHPQARFIVIGGKDAFMPEYETELRQLALTHGMDKVLQFLGDRQDIPDLMMAMDIFVWLSRGEGMPHVIAEAGAAKLAVIATPDNGALQQIEDGKSGIFVPHEAPEAVAVAARNLIENPILRARLGAYLQRKVATTYAVPVVIGQWAKLFEEVLAEVHPAPSPELFQSFYQGGFESSTHRLGNGRRLDLIESTGHDTNALGDYRQLREHGILTVRDALRWHLIEQTPGRYDFSGFLGMVKAAEQAGTQVIWDLMHYGWPDGLDIWGADFVDRFAKYARAAARAFRDETDAVPFWCPVNEISFFAWGGGDAGYLNPFARGRGFELKVQLARAAIAAMHELRAVDPRARFVHCEPAIAIHWDAARGRPYLEAEGWHQAQFQAFELISGRMWPQIGGDPSFLDIIGMNYYFNNQWIHAGPPIDVDSPYYRPLSDLLFENHARYGRPVLISETGIENDRRGSWFRYVDSEVDRARKRGVLVEGVCIYPVLDHPGWDDDRLCRNGLLSHMPIAGRREVHAPLAEALAQSVRAGGEIQDRRAAARETAEETRSGSNLELAVIGSGTFRHAPG